MKTLLKLFVSTKTNNRYLGLFLTLIVGCLAPLPWENNLAHAQQASDLLPTDELPLRASVTDTPFYLTQEDPEPSQSAPKKRDRSGWALTPVIGTLGVGGNLSRSLIRDRLNLRGGFSSVVFGGDINTRDTRYGTDLRLSGGIPLVLDWFPAKNWFRVSGGLVINRNKLELSANALDEGQTIELGGETFESDLVGDLNGEIIYNDVSPYIGIGIGNPVGRGTKFSFFLELGAMFQGSGDISLNSNGSLANDPEFLEALDQEIDDIDDEVTFSDLPVYPILQLGFSYQF